MVGNGGPGVRLDSGTEGRFLPVYTARTALNAERIIKTNQNLSQKTVKDVREKEH